mmetsp:Transcript_23572/g.50276  ORF Transcript_23572/g.50276 Transcript_23572/m.50276 type:complete len:218 (+) Transcript_23572:146-799(+)
MASGACDFCEGTGNVSEETTRQCKNCKGQGSCHAGRSNVFVCPVCNGEGEETISMERKCPDCKGTGKAGSGAKAKAKSRPVAPPAASREDGEGDDEETGKNSDSAGAQVLGKPKDDSARPAGKKHAGDTTEGPRQQRGIAWDRERGLIIEVTISPRILMNSLGTIFLFVGLILMLMQSIVWYLLGAVLCFIALGLLLKANAERLAALLPKFTTTSGG